jgi:hypothetical protein
LAVLSARIRFPEKVGEWRGVVALVKLNGIRGGPSVMLRLEPGSASYRRRIAETGLVVAPPAKQQEDLLWTPGQLLN